MVIQQSNKKLKLGNDFGIISYYKTKLKKED
jgi:hypothetical protein